MSGVKIKGMIMPKLDGEPQYEGCFTVPFMGLRFGSINFKISRLTIPFTGTLTMFHFLSGYHEYLIRKKYSCPLHNCRSEGKTSIHQIAS
jgi:hypothetical protein